jgi:two-component system phosphate regulon response regulator OmpR
LLSKYLGGEGYLVSAAANTQEASERLRDFVFDLIVLDAMMPGETGAEFATRLRAGDEPLRSAPILMLTALSETANRVAGLEAGVDDYLAKPFDPRELSLRIASILRRCRQPPQLSPELSRFGDFTFDWLSGELLRRGVPEPITAREKDILRRLVEHRGEIVSREKLAKRSAGLTINERSVDVEIARLRRKIEADPCAPRLLLTIRGQGYRLLLAPPRLGPVDSRGHS